MSAPPGQGCSWRSRSTSSSVRMPRAESGSLGTPIRVARGNGSRAPRDHTDAAVVAGATRSSAAPTRVDEVDGLRAQGEHRLGPDVDEVPGDLLAAQLPAEAVAALEHRHRGRGQRLEHLQRGGEAGDAAAHDDDVGPGGRGRDRHALSLSRATGTLDAPRCPHGCRHGARARGPACVHAGPRWSRPAQVLARTPWSWARPPPPELQDCLGPGRGRQPEPTGHRHARARRSRPASSTSTRARPGRWRRCSRRAPRC